MLPSVVARTLQDSLVDYILATLSFDDPDFTEAFEAHLRSEDGLFRGPYLRLGLPFALAAEGADAPLDIAPPFTPYAHQLQAFQQLSARGDTPTRNTLVTTGTGSGKTECFMYPVLDHCWRHRGQPGVKAIIIYPMNALATDQARRFAQVVHGDERLESQVRVGLYVGGPDKNLPTTMGQGHVIESKATQRAEPPDILLTNYKMLDFMLVRPDERRLWQHNSPQTLRYLVIDELHTFDGAQGSDVATLVRRLKSRLGTPEGHLACCGTSATIGSASDPDTFDRLAAFASEVFEEPFARDEVVRERRQGRERFLRPPRYPALPQAGDPDLSPDASDPEAWLEAQARLWLDMGAEDPVAVGEALLTHPMLGHLLALASEHPSTLAHVDAALDERAPGWSKWEPPVRQALLDGFLGLVAHARTLVGGKLRPLVTLQLQLWCRELTRLLRALPDQKDGALLPPRFGWWTDLPHLQGPEGHHAPQAHCRECGIVGLAAVQTETDRESGKLTLAPSTVGQAWLRRHRDALFVWPRPLAVEEREGQLVHWLDPDSARLFGEPPEDEHGRLRGAPVVLERTLRDRGEAKAFSARCPACGADEALSIVGSRAASLTSVAVTHLFSTPYNADKKLLAFTDSVQDACHRAGFFGGRTFRIHLRTAMQAVIEKQDPLPLSEAAEAFEAHWRAELGDLAYVASFLPPDLRELPEYTRYVDKRGKGSHKRLWKVLRARLAWEMTREMGVAAGIGRSLERSAASTVVVDSERLERAVSRLRTWLREQGHVDGDAEHFLRGLLQRMRHMGAVYHPFLEKYIRKDGNTYLLSKRQNPHMSPVGPYSRRIRFVSSAPRRDTFASPFGRRAHTGWFGDWLKRSLQWPTPGREDLARVYRRALEILVDEAICSVHPGGRGAEVWAIEPHALRLTTELGALQSGHRGRIDHVAEEVAVACEGKPSWQFRSPHRLARVEPQPGYYAAVYGRGSTTRVFPGEHTGLLSRDARTTLEERFLAGSTPEDPQAPNMLVATPTLEMGVDIGDLSAAMLCSVPPSPASYLQRIGRAGRKTGNAVLFVLANAQPHDLYFHAEPTEMLDGVIHPPGVYLGAVAMLQRQLSAWCMDHWARDDADAGPIPRKASMVLAESGRQAFLGRLLGYVCEHRQELLDGFLARFDTYLGTEARDLLTTWLLDEEGMVAHFEGAFEDLAQQISDYQAERERAHRRRRKIEDDPTSVADPQQEIRDLKRYAAVLTHLIGDLRRKYPLSVLADASLLPNYAFPETGVKLHSLLGSQSDEEDDTPKRTYEKREYVRPAARALRELAPFNTFYAEGHKVQIRQLELGPKAGRVQHWRFCPTCHFWRQAVDPSEPAPEAACPRCGDPAWRDTNQVRAMLPMTTVRSVADRVRSTTADDTEDRSTELYHLHQIFDVDPQQVDGESVLLPDLGFGFEYLKRVTLTEVNLGLQVTTEGDPKVKVAGVPASALGFQTCKDCGQVMDPRQADRRNARPEHTPFCPQHQGDTKPRLELYLFRQVSSEAVRFLLPFSEVGVEAKLRSFQAAVRFGLRQRFKGQPIHLQVSSMSEPVVGDRDQRKHYLVLFDTVPGGTGYLREYRNRREVFRLLAKTLDGLRSCSCRKRGRDGCYLCLFGRQSQRDLPVLSSHLAEDLLDRVIRARHTAEDVEGGLTGAGVSSVLESELEERFVASLEARYGDGFTSVDGGQARELRAGETTWRMVPQVDLSAEAGEPMRADFVLTAVQGPGLGQKVVVECDGFAYHVLPDQEVARVAADARKRAALISRPGWQVFSLTWDDLDASKPSARGPGALVGTSPHLWPKVLAQARTRHDLTALDGVLGRLPELTAADLLCAYLEHPGDHWTPAVATLAFASLVSSRQGGELVDGRSMHRLERHLLEEPDLEPLPPHGLAANPQLADQWTRFSQGGAQVALVSARGKDITTFQPAGLQVALRLDDTHARRQEEGFGTAWRTWLQGLNLAQFLDLDVTTSQGIAAQRSSETTAEDMLMAMGLAAEEGAAYGRDKTLLQEVLDACLDDTTRVLVQGLWDLDLPLPDVEPRELPGHAPAELTWAERRVAVVRPEDVEPEDLDHAKAGGWLVLQLPMEPRDLAHSLRTRRAP